ncbi:MAG: hypothetical protein AAFN81_14315 [Bacteroidota bacterium]
MIQPKLIDICYVVSFGFAARMLLQTKLIQQLVQAGKRVAIIAPDIEDENLKTLAAKSDVRLYAASVENSLWNEDYLYKRKYYLEEIKANPALWEKHMYSLYYSKSKHPWRRIRPLYYMLIHRLIKRCPGIRKRFLRREKRHLESTHISALLGEVQPRLVVSTYPVNILEAQVLYAARKAGISTLLHLLSWDNITSKGRFPVLADQYIVWGQVMRDELQEYYQVPEEHIHLCGVPHFDYYEPYRGGNAHEEELRQLGLQPSAPFLFFAMSAERFTPYEIDIVEQLTAAIHADAFGPELQLVVRPHPQVVQGNMTRKGWQVRLQKLVGERVAVDWPRLVKGGLRWSLQQEDMQHLAALLAGCSVCLNSGSTISIEAQLLDKPVILTSFDAGHQLPYWKSARRLIDYTHLKKLIGLGGISVVKDQTQLHQVISRYLEDSSWKQEERRSASFQQCYQQDGQATRRVKQAILQILNDQEQREQAAVTAKI